MACGENAKDAIDKVCHKLNVEGDVSRDGKNAVLIDKKDGLPIVVLREIEGTYENWAPDDLDSEVKRYLRDKNEGTL